MTPSNALRTITLAAIFLVTLTGALLAEPAHQLVARGNEAFSAGDYEKALSLYEEASVELPESAQVYFNRGAVLYKQENYEKAIEEFKDAALKSVEPGLTSRAKYNLGNCAFRQAQRQRDSDLKEAVEKCQESIAFYREARDLDPEYKKAAENIEIVRLYLKVLFDEQKKKEEQNDKEQEDNLVAKLKKLLKRQLELRDENEELAEKTPNGSDPAAAQGWQESLKELSAEQGNLHDDTSGVLEEIGQTKSGMEQQAAQAGQNPASPPQPQDPQQPPPPSKEQLEEMVKKLAAAEQHVTNALSNERGAADQLAAFARKSAARNQEQAAKHIEAAIESLASPEDEQQQKQEGDQDQEQNQDDQEKKEGEDSKDGDESQEKQDEEKKEKEGEEEKNEEQEESREGDPKAEEERRERARMEQVDDILNEAKKNQKRLPVRPGQLVPVDRDW